MQDGVEQEQEHEAEVQGEDQPGVGHRDGVDRCGDVEPGEQRRRQGDADAGDGERRQQSQQHHLAGHVLGGVETAFSHAAGDQSLGAEAGAHHEHEEGLAKGLVGHDHGRGGVVAEPAHEAQVDQLERDAASALGQERQGENGQGHPEASLRMVAVAPGHAGASRVRKNDPERSFLGG